MNAEEAIAKLDADRAGDVEIAHGHADDVLLEYLRSCGGDHARVADAWERLCDRAGGFWYA